MFNKYTGPSNKLHLQVDLNPKRGQIYEIFDRPSSSNDRCSMLHDISYSVSENIGKNDKDIKKHIVDDKWLKCFKPRSPWDIASYSAIKSKRTLGLGIDNSNKILSEELHKDKFFPLVADENG